MNRYELQWSVGYAEDLGSVPERFAPSIVPGAAAADWAAVEDWPPFWKGEECLRYQWMEDVFWTYQAELDFPELKDGKRIFFICGGVDYQFIIRLNGKTLHAQEGMNVPVEIDLTDKYSSGDVLQVVVFPPPKSGESDPPRREANTCFKPPVSYGWDFHPRLIPIGIWKEAFLEERPECHILGTTTRYHLNDDFSRAAIRVSMELSRPCSGTLQWVLSDDEGEIIDAQSIPLADVKSTDFIAEVFEPSLWWPNGQGEQYRYSYLITLHDEEGIALSRSGGRIGFRRCRLVMNEGAWDEPAVFPKSRSLPPMTMEINGREIFCKGSNWVPPEVFPGTVDEETYRPLLEKARSAHFNLIRVWGGGPVCKNSFYEICDEFGLLVWQDFTLACNSYPETEVFLDLIEREARAIVRQLRGHPSVAIWCGGNELFNNWSGMTDQHAVLRMLNKVCFEMDPNTPFLPTSPIMGVGHGGYVFRDSDGVECFQRIQDASCSAYTEFGCSGPASLELLRSVIPEDELFPPSPTPSWILHHAFGAWNGHEGAWLCLKGLEHYFGKAESLDEIVEAGQLLQGEGLRAIYEEARRQKPRCSMALSWCFNEPWPTAANNSIISWPCQPKPAYNFVRQSCRPSLASARVSKFLWKDGEIFEAELWILNDAPHPVKGDRVEAYLRCAEDEVFVLAWDFDSLDANQNAVGPILRYPIPEFDGQTFDLILRVDAKPEWNSQYLFCYQPSKPFLSEAVDR